MTMNTEVTNEPVRINCRDYTGRDARRLRARLDGSKLAVTMCIKCGRAVSQPHKCTREYLFVGGAK